jgi:adenylosuccinate lyase
MHMAISPLDGRYGKQLETLKIYFSEFALMKWRCFVELSFVEELIGTGLFAGITKVEMSRIQSVKSDFSTEDYLRIKEIEIKIRHDVKSCEVFLGEKLNLAGSNNNLIHFGLTSEDINNIAYSSILKSYLEEVQLPVLKKLITRMCEICESWRDDVFPARTHGQKASPTTAGKEMAVFISRLSNIYAKLKKFVFKGKLNGATGNFSAFCAAFPGYDWIGFSNKFVSRLGLSSNCVTTQIEDHDAWAEYFNFTRQVNNIVLDLDCDMWQYISYGYMREISEPGAVGSSTMPHKVNPINFENSEGNITISNSLLSVLSEKLCRSRMQRDLSDSTVERNIGVALAHSHLAISETLKGLDKIELNREKCLEEVKASPELLAEPMQTILRLAGIADPYTLLKNITRGKEAASSDLREFVNGLDIADEIKRKLLSLDVTCYTGLASKICDIALDTARSVIL